MQQTEQHIEKLWKLNELDIDMDDIIECMSAINIQYGVRFKLSTELPDDDYEYCINNFSGNAEETFYDKINTKGINYHTFQSLCLLYLDFSKMYASNVAQFAKKEPSKLFKSIAKLVQQENETRFGMNIKSNHA